MVLTPIDTVEVKIMFVAPSNCGAYWPPFSLGPGFAIISMPMTALMVAGLLAVAPFSFHCLLPIQSSAFATSPRGVGSCRFHNSPEISSGTAFSVASARKDLIGVSRKVLLCGLCGGFRKIR